MRQCVGIGVFVAYLVWATVAHAAGWAGIYRMEGKNPDGSTYSGAVEIEAVPNTALFQLSWMLDGVEGIAMVMFGFEHGGMLHGSGLHGPIAFSLKDTGEARWATPSAIAVLGQEKLTRSKAKTLKDAVKPAGLRASR